MNVTIPRDKWAFALSRRGNLSTTFRQKVDNWLVVQQAIGFTPMVLTIHLDIVESRVPTGAANEKPLGLSQGTVTSALVDQLVSQRRIEEIKAISHVPVPTKR